MSPVTPDKIRSLQRKLYCKAKAEPAFRFYVLYDKICREDILHHAYRTARANAGAPGVDGVTFAQIEERGLEGWLAGLREELVSKTYRPDPVRRVMIPKPNGEGERALGIPTIRDRVVQTAAKIVLEPIFEADFEDNAYGYRPARGAVDAVKDVHRHLRQGYTDVVDADLSRYFDSIPHDDLLKSVARRVADGSVLRLIKLWLKAPIEERDGDGKRRMVGGKKNKRGTPQGGVASPLLANIYMNRFLKHWRRSGCGEAFRAHVVSYAVAPACDSLSSPEVCAGGEAPMRRRKFVALLGGVVAAWPFAARAQHGGKIPRVGFMGNSTAALEANLIEPFREGLRAHGYEEGRNVEIVFRWAEGRYERFPALIAELIAANVDVIVTAGTPAALAVKKATSTVPVVMAAIGDPIGTAIVPNLARPG